jgi:hypothetical protein
MVEKRKSTDLIDRIIFEASAYRNFTDIEKLVENGADLSSLPVQPLYLSLQSASTDHMTTILPKLSPKQRQALLDIDIWERDRLDPTNFGYWLECYAKCSSDDVTMEFTKSDDFLLLLKSRLNVYTFDIEDPQYPDHDHYFLTEDNLLLIEFDENFGYQHELKSLIQRLYSELGVEDAYAHLFKMVSDSYMVWEEDAYQDKKERLRDFGMVDYMEANQALFPLPNKKALDKFIQNKKVATGAIDSEVFNQTLHSSALQKFDSGLGTIHQELQKLEDNKREDFVQFSFVRMINSTLALTDGLKSSSLEINRLSEETKSYLELGCQYISSQLGDVEGGIFGQFDFFDLYKIGKTLVEDVRSQLKKALKSNQLEDDKAQAFMGIWFSQFIEDSYLQPPKVKAFGAGLEAKMVDNLVVYQYWVDKAQQLISFVPFISGFYKNFKQLKQKNLLHDSFYHNFSIEEIDFESLLITSFINYSLGKFNSDDKKMGLKVSEFNEFVDQHFAQVKDEYVLKMASDEALSHSLNDFLKTFGMGGIESSLDYLYGILGEHLNGYEWDTMTHDDLKHVGGAILLAKE